MASSKNNWRKFVYLKVKAIVLSWRRKYVGNDLCYGSDLEICQHFQVYNSGKMCSWYCTLKEIIVVRFRHWKCFTFCFYARMKNVTSLVIEKLEASINPLSTPNYIYHKNKLKGKWEQLEPFPPLPGHYDFWNF